LSLSTYYFTQFTIPTAASSPRGIAAGPDGDMWFTEYAANKIGRVTTGGSFTQFTLTGAASGPSRIAAGPDRVQRQRSTRHGCATIPGRLERR